VYAASDTGKVQVLGKLNVATYDEIPKTVVIVPVNDTKYPYNISILRDSLNRIYGQAVVKWTVEPVEGVKDVSFGSPFDDGETGLLSNYTSDMKKVINAYKNEMDDDKFYLFLIGGSTKNDKSLAGYMPRSKQAGFIFIDQAGNEKQLIRAIAHELGHGAFNLAHTFKEEHYAMQEKTTDNLMDYKGGQKLYKFQWDKIRFPDIVIGIFEEDEDAKYKFSDLTVFKDLKNADDTYTFLSPGGKPVTLPSTTQGLILTDVYSFKNDDNSSDVSSYPMGTLLEFIIKMEDGTLKTYGARSETNYDNFVGYRDENLVLYKDIHTAKLTTHGVIVGYPCLKDGKVDFFAYKVDPDRVDESFWPSASALSDYSGGGTFEDGSAFLNRLAELELLNYSGVSPIVKGPINVGNSVSGGANVTELKLNNEEVMSFLEDVGNCGIVIQNSTLQILNIIALNPGMYTALRKCENTALVTRAEYQKHAAGHQAWYPRFVQYVKDALLKKIETRKGILAQVESVGDADDLEDMLAALCEEEYKMFSAKQRLNILETLAKGSLRDCWFAGGSNESPITFQQERKCAEAQVIYTLQYAPADQYKAIFDGLKINSELVLTLIDGLDNIGAGGNNFDRLALPLYAVWYSNVPAVTDEFIDKNKVLNYKENFLYEHAQALGVSYSSSSSYTFLFEVSSCEFKITPAIREVSTTVSPGDHQSPTGTTFTTTLPIEGAVSINVGPLDDILVRFESDMKFPGEDFVIFPKSTEPYKIPAFLLYWLIEANNNKLTMRDVMMKLNITMMALAGAEMATARGIRLLFATVDLITASTTLILPEVRKELVERMNDLDPTKRPDPIWLEIMDGYDNLVRYYYYFRGGQAASLLFRASILKLASYKNLFPKLTENIKNLGLTKKTVDQIDELVSVLNGLDGTIPPPLPSGPVSPLFKGISAVDKELLGLSPVRINTSGFQNNGFSNFVEASAGGYQDVMAQLGKANYSSFGLSSGTAEVFIKEGVATLPKVYPAGIKVTQQISVKVVQAADASVAVQAVKASTAPKLAIAQIMQTADGAVISIASDPAESSNPAASPSLLPQIVYAAPAVVTKVLKKIEEENQCTVCIDKKDVCKIFEQIRDKAVVGANMNAQSAATAINRICQNVNNIMLPGVAAKINGMEPTNIKFFLEDILGTYNITNAPNNAYALNNNVQNLYPKLIDGWLECKAARPRGLIRLDVSILRLAGDDTQNANFMSALTIRGENKYRKLLKVYVGPCNTCPAPPDSIAPAKLPMMDVYLSTFEQFAKQYSSKRSNGLDDFISGEATADFSTKQDGAYHLMRHLNIVSVSTVSGFEQVISRNVQNPVCINCKCDVLMQNGTMVDYKSYQPTSIPAKIYGTQFKQYLQRWSPTTKFKYVFNANKASEDEVKQRFQSIFKNHPEVFNINPSFFLNRKWNNVTIKSLQDFKDLLELQDFWQSDLFGFIEIN